MVDLGGRTRRGVVSSLMEGMTATPIDIPVCWAVGPSDERRWRTSGFDCFLRWRAEHARWCFEHHQPLRFSAQAPRAVAATWVPCDKAIEYRGRVLAFHPEGCALVMETTRVLLTLPVAALRAEEP